jgi:hypothetical protein
MLKRGIRSSFILCLALICNSIPFASADYDTPARILSSKTVSGSRTIEYVSGNTEESGILWTAKVPTKMKLSGPRSSLSGKVTLKVANLATSSEKSELRVTFALFSKSCKPITDRTIYEWSPVSRTTELEINIYQSDKIRAGQYFWVITTYNYQYSGKGELKVPVTLS